jgi:hypothetical protein
VAIREWGSTHQPARDGSRDREGFPHPVPDREDSQPTSGEKFFPRSLFDPTTVKIAPRTGFDDSVFNSQCIGLFAIKNRGPIRLEILVDSAEHDTFDTLGVQ